MIDIATQITLNCATHFLQDLRTHIEYFAVTMVSHSAPLTWTMITEKEILQKEVAPDFTRFQN